MLKKLLGVFFCKHKKTAKPTSKMASLLVPPASVQGSSTLDRDAFSTTLKVPYYQLESNSLSDAMPVLKKYILKRPQFKAVQTSFNTVIAYLDPEKVKNPEEDIPEKDRTLLDSKGKFQENGELTLKYENWTVDEVLRAVLPKNIEVPTSFSRVGHIVHLNLRDSQLPFKNLIGEVYLDKVPQVRTVVNKTNNIDATYRFFAMEFLAGDQETVVCVKENKCTFHFDFAKVYWNPRLSTEHEILLTFLKPKDTMYDVFAGVGPFAIPAAKQKVSVLANDLNPESYKWLQKNMTANKIKKDLECYNLDGREFIRTVAKKHILERRKLKVEGSEHFVMNLPAMAVEFLDVFLNWLSEDEISMVGSKPIKVHVYCFVKLQEKDEDPKCRAVTLVEDELGKRLNPEDVVDVHYVRNVAPKKEMMRVSFLLTERILRSGEPATKKKKMNDNDDFAGVAGKNGSQAEVQ